MEREIARLNDEVNTLTTLNRQLEWLHEQENAKKAKLEEVAPVSTNMAENIRRRLVTYQGDSMVMVEVQDIAFIFLSENNVMVQTFLQKQYMVNISLDELMKQLDNEIFYRANRQFVINVNAIHSILAFGRNQLQLVTQPKSQEEIIISKNKVAEFKKWLDR